MEASTTFFQGDVAVVKRGRARVSWLRCVHPGCHDVKTAREFVFIFISMLHVLHAFYGALELIEVMHLAARKVLSEPSDTSSNLITVGYWPDPRISTR